MDQAAANYGTGIPRWSPYRMGFEGECLESQSLKPKKENANVIGGKLLPPEFRAPPTKAEVTKDLDQAIKPTLSNQPSGGMPRWSPLFNAENQSPDELHARATVRDAAHVAQSVSRSTLRDKSNSLHYSFPGAPQNVAVMATEVTEVLVGGQNPNLGRPPRPQGTGHAAAMRRQCGYSADGAVAGGAGSKSKAKALQLRQLGASKSEDSARIEAQRRAIFQAATMGVDGRRGESSGGRSAVSAAAFLGRSRVNERVQARPTPMKLPENVGATASAARSLARARGAGRSGYNSKPHGGSPPQQQPDSARRSNSGGGNGRQAGTGGASATGEGAENVGTTAAVVTAALPPDDDPRAMTFATKELSDKYKQNYGDGIPKWSPYHRGKKERVNPRAFATRSKEYGSHSLPDSELNEGRGDVRSVTSPRTQAVAARKNNADMKAQACVDHTWELFGARPKAAMLDHVGKTIFVDQPDPYSKEGLGAATKINPFVRAMGAR